VELVIKNEKKMDDDEENVVKRKRMEIISAERVFQGQIESKIRCLECENESVHIEKFLGC